MTTAATATDTAAFPQPASQGAEALAIRMRAQRYELAASAFSRQTLEPYSVHVLPRTIAESLIRARLADRLGDSGVTAEPSLGDTLPAQGSRRVLMRQNATLQMSSVSRPVWLLSGKSYSLPTPFAASLVTRGEATFTN